MALNDNNQSDLETRLRQLSKLELRFLAYDYLPNLYAQWQIDRALSVMRQELLAELQHNDWARKRIRAALQLPKESPMQSKFTSPTSQTLIALVGAVFTLFACIGTWMALYPLVFSAEPTPTPPPMATATIPVEQLTVTVVDDLSGEPLAGANVVVLSNGDSFNQSTDANGIARFALDFAGNPLDVMLTVSRSGYKTESLNITVRPETVQTVRLTPQ